jgi:hypothetical protein
VREKAFYVYCNSVIENFSVQILSFMTVTTYVIRTCVRQTAVKKCSKCTCSAVVFNKPYNLYCCYGDQTKVAVVRIREMRNPYNLVGIAVKGRGCLVD